LIEVVVARVDLFSSALSVLAIGRSGAFASGSRLGFRWLLLGKLLLLHQGLLLLEELLELLLV
jgi:hypothetical protein